jgi:hypothetical protein
MMGVQTRCCGLRYVDPGAWNVQNASKRGPNQMLKTNSDITESLVTCQTSQGIEVLGSLLWLTPYLAVFEVIIPAW